MEEVGAVLCAPVVTSSQAAGVELLQTEIISRLKRILRNSTQLTVE